MLMKNQHPKRLQFKIITRIATKDRNIGCKNPFPESYKVSFAA